MHPLFLPLLRRGLALWLLARLALFGAGLMLGGVFGAGSMLADLEPLDAATRPSIWALLLTAGLAVVELHRRRERALFGNLGLSRTAASLVQLVPALIAELLLALVPR